MIVFIKVRLCDNKSKKKMFLPNHSLKRGWDDRMGSVQILFAFFGVGFHDESNETKSLCEWCVLNKHYYYHYVCYYVHPKRIKMLKRNKTLKAKQLFRIKISVWTIFSHILNTQVRCFKTTMIFMIGKKLFHLLTVLLWAWEQLKERFLKQ